MLTKEAKKNTISILPAMGVSRSEVALEYVPLPDFLDFRLPTDFSYLVSNDGTEVTLHFIEKLLTNGEKVAVLNFPKNLVPQKIQLPQTISQYDLEEITDEAIKTILNKIKVGSFVHLHPHFSFQYDFSQHLQTEKQILLAVFLLAKHLSKNLQEFGKTNQRANFLTISRLDGYFGTKNNGKTSIGAGALAGFVKCFDLEWSSVFCRSVDIKPNFSAEKIAQIVFEELHDSDRSIKEIAYSEHRQKWVIKDVQLPENQAVETKITSQDVFLVSGGAKGVTAACIKKLAQIYQCKFILLGRSELQENEPEWAKGIENEADLKRKAMEFLLKSGEKPMPKTIQKLANAVLAQREINETLAQLKQAGSQAVYLAADVMNPEKIQKLLPQAQHLGKITGFIHGAGVLADKLIENKTADDFDFVYSVKVEGLVNILKLLNLNDLRYLALFSSVAGFYGNFGQSDYAAANEVLNKAAYLFQKNHPNCHAISMNWGAWDSGMVSGELKKMFDEHGVSLVNTEGGANLFVNELISPNFGTNQVILGSTLPAGNSYIGDLQSFIIKRNLLLSNNKFLEDHSIMGNAVLPIVNAVGWIAETCASLYPDFKLFGVEDVRLFKGIVFDGTQADDYVLELKELVKNQDELVFEGKISSKKSGQMRYHYATTIILKKQIPVAPTVRHEVENATPILGKEFYENGTLFHKNRFMGISKSLIINDKQILLECFKTQFPVQEQGQFPVRRTNAFLNDIQYQGLLVWVKYQKNALSLPLKTKSVRIYDKLHFNKKFFVKINITEATDFKASSDIVIYDENGKVIMETFGAEVTLSKELKW